MNGHNKLPMLTPDCIDRRSLLKGVSLGAGAVVLQPFVNALAAEARGEAPPPRLVFVVEANGLWEHHICSSPGTTSPATERCPTSSWRCYTPSATGAKSSANPTANSRTSTLPGR